MVLFLRSHSESKRGLSAFAARHPCAYIPFPLRAQNWAVILGDRRTQHSSLYYSIVASPLCFGHIIYCPHLPSFRNWTFLSSRVSLHQVETNPQSAQVLCASSCFWSASVVTSSFAFLFLLLPSGGVLLFRRHVCWYFDHSTLPLFSC